MNLDWRNYAPEKENACWRASRIAARLFLKLESGKPPSPRDLRLCQELTTQPGVTNRLIDQALACLQAQTRI